MLCEREYMKLGFKPQQTCRHAVTTKTAVMTPRRTFIGGPLDGWTQQVGANAEATTRLWFGTGASNRRCVYRLSERRANGELVFGFDGYELNDENELSHP